MNESQDTRELLTGRDRAFEGRQCEWSSRRKVAKVKHWFLNHTRYQIHFAHTGGSWINLVERFFFRITNEAMRWGSFQSVKQLQSAIEAYVAEHKKEPEAFIWTATADLIFGKLETNLSK
jgi:hypothetical protein